MKPWLIISIFLNVALLIGAWWAVQRLGGWDASMYRLKNKGLSGIYENRKDLFVSLDDDEGEIVLLGDSLTEKGEWSESFGSLRVKNRGIVGDYAKGVLDRLDEVVRSKPKAIFLMVGVNDLMMGMAPEHVAVTYHEIITTIRKKSPETVLYVESILPINAKKWTLRDKNKDIDELNGLLRQLAADMDVPFIDLHTKMEDGDGHLNELLTYDGIHLNGKAYAIWVETLQPLMIDL